MRNVTQYSWQGRGRNRTRIQERIKACNKRHKKRKEQESIVNIQKDKLETTIVLLALVMFFSMIMCLFLLLIQHSLLFTPFFILFLITSTKCIDAIEEYKKL